MDWKRSHKAKCVALESATEEELATHRKLPHRFKDPISLEMMKDPVRATDGVFLVLSQQ